MVVFHKGGVVVLLQAGALNGAVVANQGIEPRPEDRRPAVGAHAQRPSTTSAGRRTPIIARR